MSSSTVARQDRFNRLFSRYYNNIVYYSLHYLHDIEESKEVAQDVFTIVWQHLDELEDDAFPYMLVVAKHQCLKSLRKEKHKHDYCSRKMDQAQRELESSLLEDSDIGEVMTKEIHEILSKAMTEMKPKTKEAFYMSRFEDKTYAEIAQFQKVSVKNIEYRISSALKVLRKYFSEMMPLFLGLLFSTGFFY